MYKSRPAPRSFPHHPSLLYSPSNPSTAAALSLRCFSYSTAVVGDVFDVFRVARDGGKRGLFAHSISGTPDLLARAPPPQPPSRFPPDVDPSSSIVQPGRHAGFAIKLQGLTTLRLQTTSGLAFAHLLASAPTCSIGHTA
ncbi:hypothetical protein AURDEDRAFT_177253 [Auricularia subglabra TFB-10046 SS5]|uniref:Uncharacterized protein n=1 Tax=Auricularia subglabra (strain TFB-10046 / SS5) TaxID=717982 RepID=J0WMS4_AURST|nr:hypothetical protein AURDEDRAFT_177253 [Auricularia subglabra TFB-10046 SS5]